MPSVMYKAINNDMYSIVDCEEYFKNPELYAQFYAIKMPDGNLYPIRQIKTDSGQYPTVGAYCTPEAVYFRKPATEEELKTYSFDSGGVIDFGAVDNMREYIMTKKRLANAERAILTNIDNIYVPETTPDDTPEMIALKQAIADKHIDLDKYEQRFGPNYNNDKRLLKKNNITFRKLRSVCKALDMKATIIFEDANPDVPNPIGRAITAELVGDDMSIEEEDE